MTNRLYAKGAEKLLAGTLLPLTETLKIALVSNAYAENLDTDEFYTSIAAHVIDTPQTLTGKTGTGGIFKCSNPNWAAVAAGSTIECFVVYKDTGVAGTSPLLARIDVVPGLPFNTNGGAVSPTIDAVNGLFKLVP